MIRRIAPGTDLSRTFKRVHFVGNRASLDGGAPRAFASDAPAQARFDAAGPPPSADAVDDIPF